MTPTVKVARPGYNANTCPDWALVFNSLWPSLPIAFETTVTSTLGSASELVFHNLGFPPLTMVWISYNGISYSRLAPQNIEATSTFILINPEYLASYAFTLVIRCYNIDISQEAKYPLPQSSSIKLVPDLTTGIKIVKGQRNIQSKNLNDFILNSQAQSPAVLAICTEKGQYFNTSSGQQYITYPLGTSYIPWALGMTNEGTTSQPAYTFYSTQDLIYTASNNSLSINITEFGAGTLILLRDPLFYPNNVSVVY